MLIIRNVKHKLRIFKDAACTLSQNTMLMSTEPSEPTTNKSISNESDVMDIKSGGYAKAFTKFETLQQPYTSDTPKTFAHLLRHSKFIDMGDPEGKVVIGKIFHIVEDDLYIDFGWKFHCVCPRPSRNSSQYVRGAKVRLLIKDLELSSKFLGYERDLTLLEADGVLLGLAGERQNVGAHKDPS